MGFDSDQADWRGKAWFLQMQLNITPIVVQF